MPYHQYRALERDELERKLKRERLDNTDPRLGFAFVNVLDPEAFHKEHIPGSINIPRLREDEFEKRYARDKEIVVYCASTECNASREVARELVRRGFSKVSHYEGGMSDWKKAGRITSGTA